jgi:epoxide hydrolase
MQPFRIAVPDAVLADLSARLANTRWPAELPGTGWRQGADLPWLRDLCDYWGRGYDWRRHEAGLNRWPQFVVEIDGVAVHVFHVRGRGPRPLPLLLIHGWPGSVVEFQSLLGPLSDPAAHGLPAEDSFDLVVPSIPGFGFGGQPRVPGWGATRIAAALDHLMTQVLGYPSYAIQGGDWGTILGRRIARNHGAHVRALHVNMAYAPPPPGTPADPAAAARGFDLTGYLHLQNTRADTLTTGLSDSPAGLAAWILEKFRSWSDCNGSPEDAIARDVLLTNLMFYWAPNSIASATRIYFETAVEGDDIWATPAVAVPTGVAAFPKEPYLAPRAWVERLYDVRRWTDMPRGGHFAALEAPELLAADVRSFLRDYRD